MTIARWPAGDIVPRRFLLLLAAAAGAAGLALVASGGAIHAKALVAQVLLANSFDAAARPGEPARPWPWADFGAEAKLVARRLGESEIVLSDAGGESLAFGPTRIAGTPLPGEPGTAVIAAHRDTHFRWLRHLRPGDLIDVIDRNAVRHTFAVRTARIAHADRSGIDANRAGRFLALATCYPFDAATRGPLRYIVEAELVESAALADQR